MTYTADVIVIGAGIVGAATAHRFAAAGRRVVVLDRGVPNGEGSGASAANIHVQGIHTRRPGQGVPVDVRRLLPLQKAGRDKWSDVADELGESVGFVTSGGFMVADTAAGVLALTEKWEWEQSVGLDTEIIDGDSARSALPLLGPEVLAATWCSSDAFADPALVVPAYLRAAQRNGTEVFAGHAVTALRKSGRIWTVDAGDKSFEAPLVINAAGPWMGRIASLIGLDLRLAPLAIQMHRLHPTDLSLPFLIQHVSEGLSVKQDSAGRIILGGGWPAKPWSLDERPEILEESIAGNIAQVRRILPQLAELPLESVWPGALGATPDEMPVIGQLAGVEGMLVAGGTYSFTFGPLWADTLLAVTEGLEPLVPVAAFSPDRLLAQTAPATAVAVLTEGSLT